MESKVKKLLTGDYPNMSILELQRIGARQKEHERFEAMMQGCVPDGPEWGIETWYGEEWDDS